MSLDNSCIGHLENTLHHVFSSVRVPGEEFVFYPTSNDLKISKDHELFGALDEYCD